MNGKMHYGPISSLERHLDSGSQPTIRNNQKSLMALTKPHGIKPKTGRSK
jgi:hypothetical protein